MTELQEKYGDRGFTVLAFPSHSFRQERKDNAEIYDWAVDEYGANYPIFEKIVVNGDDTHPIYANLKAMARTESGGKVDTLKWNFDKFLVQPDGDSFKVLDYSTSKKKPVDYEDEIEMHLK